MKTKNRKIKLILIIGIIIAFIFALLVLEEKSNVIKIGDKLKKHNPLAETYNEKIKFNDPILFRSVKVELNRNLIDYTYDDSINQISITKDNVLNVTSLNCAGSEYSKITDLSGIENFTGLTHLYLEENNIEDLTPLSSLTKLKHLELQNNKISDLKALSGLVKLEYLDLSNNKISIINYLNNLRKLEKLYLSDNSIYDDSLIDSLPNLEEVEINHQELFLFVNGDEFELPPLFANAKRREEQHPEWAPYGDYLWGTDNRD